MKAAALARGAGNCTAREQCHTVNTNRPAFGEFFLHKSVQSFLLHLFSFFPSAICRNSAQRRARGGPEWARCREPASSF